MQSSVIASTLEHLIRHYGEDAGALTNAAKHHFSSTGKRTRAKLLIAASPSIAYPQALMHAAIAIELIHEASIVHDDIQDRTVMRRNVQTVWHKFGANTALLLGDHLVACAFRAIAEAPTIDHIRSQLMVALSQAVSRAASGQHLQLSHRTNPDYKSFYDQVAKGKTGAFIALPLQFAALLNSNSDAPIQAARCCGEQLGLAYQILNDLAPYHRPETLAEHEDLRNRTITAPVAACNALFSRVDPFYALVSKSEVRAQAMALCQHWLDEALASARFHAKLLPQDSVAVIEAFIAEHLSYSHPDPLPTSNPEPWQHSAATATAEAI